MWECEEERCQIAIIPSLQTQSWAERRNLPSCSFRFTHQVKVLLCFQGSGSTISEPPWVVVSPASLC